MHKHHLCLVFELLSITLYELLKRGNFQGLPLPVIRKFAHQLLLCLDFLALPDVNVIHSDLKPEVGARRCSCSEGHVPGVAGLIRSFSPSPLLLESFASITSPSVPFHPIAEVGVWE